MVYGGRDDTRKRSAASAQLRRDEEADEAWDSENLHNRQSLLSQMILVNTLRRTNTILAALVPAVSYTRLLFRSLLTADSLQGTTIPEEEGYDFDVSGLLSDAE